MMLWCELHNTTGVKGGITNFDASEYEKDIPWLQSITQVGRACQKASVQALVEPESTAVQFRLGACCALVQAMCIGYHIYLFKLLKL